jgi:hypothetical protein
LLSVSFPLLLDSPSDTEPSSSHKHCWERKDSLLKAFIFFFRKGIEGYTDRMLKGPDDDSTHKGSLKGVRLCVRKWWHWDIMKHSHFFVS